ncbi:MAG: hypothetical protein C0501_07380 [Isosphaera sp.]|nr:hypothetical protein [Isosphaera sp.]
MVPTSLVVAAALSAAPSPAWQADYAKARTAAAAENKPMAVFIGSGDAVGRMIADGTIPADAAKLLRDSYVCVSVDTATGAGRELAGRFDLAEGLVISGPGGASQALRHAGAVSGADLTRQLGQYAKAGQPVTTVSTGLPAAGQVVTAGYAPAMTYAPMTVYGGCAGGTCGAPVMTYSGCAGGNCRVAAPVMSYGFPAYPVGGSSCANGRCR